MLGTYPFPPDITISHLDELYGPYSTGPQRTTGALTTTGTWTAPVIDKGGTRFSSQEVDFSPGLPPRRPRPVNAKGRKR